MVLRWLQLYERLQQQVKAISSGSSGVYVSAHSMHV
jgi:hypothetical protein